MTECKLAGLVQLERPLERPQMSYASLSSRNSSQESLTLSTTLSTRKIGALPTTLRAEASNDHVRTYCKQLILEYKELQTQLSKFTNRSSQGSKTNLLRLSVLRFLRLPNHDFMKTGLYEKEMHAFILKTATYGAKVLNQWWVVLLEELNHTSSTSTKLSSIDRSVYLECVSRIMARREWDFVKRSSDAFSEHLILTLEYCYQKLIPMKTTPLSINAFIGKTFAYCFMEVHNFAPLLLFTLFVKNYTITKLFRIVPQKPIPTEAFQSTTHEKALPTLLKFMGYHGDFEQLLRQEEFPPKLLGATCMYPPKMTTFDDLEINLKDNAWVKKWAGFDSDVFCSFLKHYLDLCFETYDITSHQELFHCPGYIIIYGHIMEMFDSSVGHIKKFRAQQYKDPNGLNNETMIMASYSSQNGTRQDFQKFLAKLPIIPIFKVLRTIMYESEFSHGKHFVKSIEQLICSRALRVHAYDSQTCEAIYDIFTEFLIHLQHDTQKFSRQLDWHFWISGLVNMIQTGHMVCQVKALCFLFNIWNMLPIDFIVKTGDFDTVWICSNELTLIYNLSNFLICKPIWEELFGHWNPLVRHYYNRLIVFKVVGTSNDNYGSYLAFRKALKFRLSSSFDLFKDSVGNTELTLVQSLDIQPANPIANKKLVITPIDQMSTSSSSVNILESFNMSTPYTSASGTASASSSTSTLLLPSNRKMYAYDIFDDAIYSSSIGSAAGPALPRSSSRSSTNSPTLSPSSIKRSSSSSTLARVPILGTALNFFKKSSGSQPNLQVQATQSPLPTSPIPESSYEDLKFLRPSPYLNTNTSSMSSSGSRSPSFMKKSPSILSSPASSISEISDDDPDALLNYSKTRQQKSPGSVKSHLNSVSSANSLASMSSMDALPTPPELLKKIPEFKRFRYKFQLTFSNDAVQFQSRVTKSKDIKFFRDIKTVEAPKRPLLPFEKNSMGLLGDDSYTNLDELSDDGSDGFDEYLMIPGGKPKYVDMKDVVEFKGLQNHVLLGKFLNEWKIVVDEYEKFMNYTNECVSPDENSFVDPMLIADIPPIKVK